ncbi:MAG TPA: hypothetical protein VFO62_00670 [Candidatus Binatia bacterium]|nr:hypothetical protein [Candidatus Binatia bacterium]
MSDANPFADLAGLNATGTALVRDDDDADAAADGDLVADPMQELRALSAAAGSAETVADLRQIVADVALRAAEACELLDDDDLEEYVEPETMRPIYDLLQVAGLILQILGERNGAPASAAEAAMSPAAKQQWGTIMGALPAIVEQSNLKLSYLAEQSNRMRGDDDDDDDQQRDAT